MLAITLLLGEILSLFTLPFAAHFLTFLVTGAANPLPPLYLRLVVVFAVLRLLYAVNRRV